MLVLVPRRGDARPGFEGRNRSGLRARGGARGLRGLGRLLAEFPHLAVHLLDLTLQEILLELDDFLRVLGAHELLREVEGRFDVRFREGDRLAIALRLMSRAPAWAASADASMAPYIRVASR